MKKKGVASKMFDLGKKGQVTIFIIIAILLVVGVSLYFILRTDVQTEAVPEEFQPAYTSFLTCIEDSASTGISILLSRGGYIGLPEFEPGSGHMPFSSQFNFMGTPIPYWYYVSGNNIQREQVPSKEAMETQLQNFIDDRVEGCNFESYYDQGFEISWAEPSSRVEIMDDRVDVELEMNLNFARGDESVLVRHHDVSVNSGLGSLYDSALAVYEEEQESLFLEGYAVDTLRLYAPVDGVEISCSPQVWNAEEVFDELQEGVEANTLALSSGESVDDYFEVGLPVNEEVRFLQSRDWPHSIEVTPSDGAFMISNPVGNQPGLGALGFCYVPYHFVYSMKYPVLVQVYSDSGLDGEVFQFPMAVVIENNNPRESLEGEASQQVDPELCQYKNTEQEIRVRDKQGAPVEADISYECFGNRCNIGESPESGVLVDDFPQCVNGFVTARAEGFKETSRLFSTVESDSTTIIMDRIYDKQIQLRLDGQAYNGEAIIYFLGDDFTRTVIYPEQRSVSLAEGQYEVQVHIYEDSEITMPETVTEQCVDVPRSGALGFLGLTEERCFEIEIPEQVVSQVLAGGGQQNHFILEDDLMSSGMLEINAESFSIPETTDQLHFNYLLFEESGLEINFG